MAKTADMLLTVSLTVILCSLYSGVQAQVKVVVPQGIASVNGSAADMGCTSPLVASGGFMVCTAQNYLVDGCSPDIDTSTSDWASQLVTVRRNEETANILLNHVLLTFGFDTAVSLTGIEIDVFLCPEWKISAPQVSIYFSKDSNLEFVTNLPFISPGGPSESQTSCDSLSTLTIAGNEFHLTRTLHVLVALGSLPSIDLVYVGEVRFLGMVPAPRCTVTASCEPSSSTVTASCEPSSSTVTASCEPSSSHDGTLQKVTSYQLLPTSVPGDRENDCTCSEESSSSAVIAVSAVSLLLIVILTTVILTQCLLIIRMRRSRNKTETYAEATSPTTNTTHVPVSLNEAYALTKLTSPSEEVTYETPN